MGYPTTDELPSPFGRITRFQRGLIYWTPWTGAHEVRWPVAVKWNSKNTVWLLIIGFLVILIGNVATLILLLLNYIFNKLLDEFFGEPKR